MQTTLNTMTTTPPPSRAVGVDVEPRQERYPRLVIQPVDFDEACAFVSRHHRHHPPSVGHKFSIAVNDGEKVVGVIVVGRPVARMLQDGWTLEVTRCCTDGTRNAASLLYGAARRAAWALGYKKLITYCLASESGVSLRAAGWREIGSRGGGEWDRKSRPRVSKAPTGQKTLWEAQ